MSYKSKFGITKIINSKYGNLSISWDSQDPNPKNKRGQRPVFLYTPNMDNTNEHYHIALTRKQAKILSKWLIDYLN